ncbi:MAG: hypothetical protein ACPGUY_06010 [Akkermansiaceae bacterium]
MRGSPPVLALLLLLALIGLGIAGRWYIDHDVSAPKETETPNKNPITHEIISAEVELEYSSAPLKCVLRYITEDGEEVLIDQSGSIENPDYTDVSIPAHALKTYWLDITWANAPAEEDRHFAKIKITPSHGKEKEFTFLTSEAKMEETFDYTTGGEPR